MSIALFYIEKQNIVGISIVVCALKVFQMYIDSRNTIIHRDAQEVVDIHNITVNAGHSAVILNANSHTATVGIGHGSKYYGKPFGVNTGTLSIESLAFRSRCQCLNIECHSALLTLISSNTTGINF